MPKATKNGKFKLFMGSNYYPSPAYGDFIERHDTLDNAKAASRPRLRKEFDWLQIVEGDTIVLYEWRK